MILKLTIMGGQESNELISFPVWLLLVILDFCLGFLLSWETEESLGSSHRWSCQVEAFFLVLLIDTNYLPSMTVLPLVSLEEYLLPEVLNIKWVVLLMKSIHPSFEQDRSVCENQCGEGRDQVCLPSRLCAAACLSRFRARCLSARKRRNS